MTTLQAVVANLGIGVLDVVAAPEGIDVVVDDIAVHDSAEREKHTDYVATLHAYLDHFGDVPAAAASLDVHPNTFRYRLRRLVEVSGLDLDDPVERLVAHLQLTLAP